MHCSLLLLVFVTNTVSAYYDNRVTTKSYELDVPGSNPIRIIETDPLWNRRNSEQFVTTPEPWTGVEHRSLKTGKVANRLKNDIHLQNENLEIEEDSRELNQFLKNYAEKLKRTRPIPSAEQGLVSDERFDKVELVTKPDDAPTNRLANLLLVNNKNENKSGEVKVKQRNPPRDRKQRPTEEKKGWVSLEVVPWSVSKVAKWHSSIVKQEDKMATQPNWYHLLNKQSYNTPLSTYKSKPFVYDPDMSTNFKQGVQDIIYPEHQMGSAAPLSSLPPSFEEKLYLKDYDIDSLRPTIRNKYQHVYGHHGNKDRDCENSAIITDGLPPNFPTYSTNLNRRKDIADDGEHPLTHPFNGAGEWILVTTTKGYKASHDRQRSLDIEAIPERDDESINTHKSVRLTVLPPLNNSRINMTTSHGGLLQVESTFETVDEAQKTAERKENMKKSPIKRKPFRRPLLPDVLPSANVVSTTSPAVINKFKIPSASSVLAAVGAGMIPATMAMLVPMAMGKRRKREVLFKRKRVPIYLTNYL